MRLHASAPTRIDLAGGTLDIWPLYLFHPGAVTVNVAISRKAHCSVEPRADRRIVLINRDAGWRASFSSLDALRRAKPGRPTAAGKLALLARMVEYFAPAKGVTVSTWSEVPAGAGLGGSSALAIAIGAALARWLQRRMKPAELIWLARDLEARVLGVPTGEQDHYPAAFGGVNAVHLDPLRTSREGLAVDLRELESRLLLVYTGMPRNSGQNNWQVLKGYLDGNRRLRRSFAVIAQSALDMRAALLDGNWNRVHRLLSAEWAARRRNAPGISTPFIDKLERVGKRSGAAAAKVCGAGGGGCVVFLCRPGRRSAVAQALLRAGATLLPFRIARRGVDVKEIR